MRLDFNVLWVEDQPNGVNAQIKSLEGRMATEGFKLNPTICATIDAVSDQLSDDVFNDEVDMILVDWELGKGESGEVAIAQVRDSIPYKDIVFYSARTDTNTLRQLAFDLGLEGIYFSHRNELVDEVFGIFESLIKKALDLDHIRGIVMGATSDIDQLTRDCLTVAHEMSGAEERAAILAEMLDLLDKKMPNLEKRVAKIKKKATFSSILLEHMTFTANDGVRILKRVINTNQFKSCQKFRDPIGLYIQQVVPKRNILGHKVLSPEGKPIAIAGMPGETISVEEMKELRCLLLELRDEFRRLHGTLAAQSN